MKKFFIAVLLLISAISFGQRKSWYATITNSSSGGADTIALTGTDTIVWANRSIDYLFGPGLSVDLKFHELDADDATFSIVVANQDSLWHYTGNSFPLTLNRTTYSYTNEYGDTISSWMGRLDNMLYKKIGIRFTKGSCSSYSMKFYLYQE